MYLSKVLNQKGIWFSNNHNNTLYSYTIKYTILSKKKRRFFPITKSSLQYIYSRTNSYGDSLVPVPRDTINSLRREIAGRTPLTEIVTLLALKRREEI